MTGNEEVERREALRWLQRQLAWERRLVALRRGERSPQPARQRPAA